MPRGRVGVDPDDHLGEVGLTEAEGGLARANAVDRPVDRTEVHLPFISERSITRPSSQVPRLGPLCPPPRTANGSWCSRAKLTAAITSATSTQRTISAGCLSIMPL